ncbi:MAG: Dipeptide transport ATP-binding protein DppD [Rhodocyclaceae bacterium]|nr:Dipeptide transport ATP-binding protein DppD [Rhodocyclaceae bacterium]
MSGPQPPLLAVSALSVEFRTRSGKVRALDNVSLTLRKGELVALVGESGSGKSVTAFAIMRVLDPAARITSGSLHFGGMDLLAMKDAELAELRGRELSMIFQNPRAALNPIRRVGRQIEDVLLRHAAVPRQALRAQAIAALTQVRIPDPEKRYAAYPHELSGGMCQRIMIAMALACRPALLIADEPTTGLDVTTQAAILDLMRELAHARGMAMLLITHDLGLAAEYCDRVVVMHAGHVVETAPTSRLLSLPRHPYSAKLIAATPRVDRRLDDLAAIAGNLPDLRRADLPPCRFSERCDRYTPTCAAPLPSNTVAAEHAVACHHPL